MKPKEIADHNIERLKEVQSFLRMYRINDGYTQQELSDQSDIHRNTIVRLESNQPQNITLLTIFEIADALEIDINQIFLEIE